MLQSDDRGSTQADVHLFPIGFWDLIHGQKWQRVVRPLGSRDCRSENASNLKILSSSGFFNKQGG
jgi:hypothetical protein